MVFFFAFFHFFVVFFFFVCFRAKRAEHSRMPNAPPIAGWAVIESGWRGSCKLHVAGTADHCSLLSFHSHPGHSIPETVVWFLRPIQYLLSSPLLSSPFLSFFYFWVHGIFFLFYFVIFFFSLLCFLGGFLFGFRLALFLPSCCTQLAALHFYWLNAASPFVCVRVRSCVCVQGYK